MQNHQLEGMKNGKQNRQSKEMKNGMQNHQLEGMKNGKQNRQLKEMKNGK